MDSDEDDGSGASDRTALSESEDEVVTFPVEKFPLHPLVSRPKKDVGDNIQRQSHLADLWQFLLSPAASELKRFHTYSFIPAETVTNIAQGTSYRVSKSKLSTESQQVVAIKHIILQPSVSSVETYESLQNTVQTVLRELRVLAHKPVRRNVRIAQLLGYGVEEIENRLTVYLVAEYCQGGTLKDYLAAAPEERVSMLDRAILCSDIACGLAGLHACSIVHGDLKLANILLFAGKNGYVARLSDFGCSIYEGTTAYTGSIMYNAPEIRHPMSVADEPQADFYASDIFSFGLVVWETLQGGRAFIDLAVQENGLGWLNSLPRDDLLLQALQAIETLPTVDKFPRRVIRAVLEGSLRDEPGRRLKCQAIVDMFNTDRTFSNSDRGNCSYFESSTIPPLRKWSPARTDNLARTVPLTLQAEMYAQFGLDADCTTNGAPSLAHFHLAICHLIGFGTIVSPQKFLETLTEGVLRGDPYCSGMYLRMHSALHAPMTVILPPNQPIVSVERDLAHLPKELYYAHRLREHERTFQQGLLKHPFDIMSGASILSKAAIIEERDTLEAIETILPDLSSSKTPLFAVTDCLDGEDSRYLFHVAARLGLINIVQMFLSAGFDVNSEDDNRATPLIAACRGGHSELASFLIDHGADPWKRQRNGISPFHWLMMFDDSQVHLVLERLRGTHNSMVMDAVVAEPVELLAHGLRLRWSPVHFAVAARNLTVTKALIDAGASMKGGSSTPLNIAVANHCPEMTKLLLSYKLPSWQLTPFLHIGEVSTLKLILLHGDQRPQNLDRTAQEVLNSSYCDVNQKDREGYNALTEAIRVAPYVPVFKLMYSLLAREDGRAGAILDFLITRKVVEATPQLLAKALTSGDRGILDSVLATGIDVNNSTDELPPLYCAVLFSKNSYAVEALINRGADVNQVFEIDSQSMPVLQMCLSLPEGDGQMLDALIKGGASLISSDGSTIVHIACQVPARVNEAHVLSYLFNKHPQTKSFVNHRDHDDFTPIHFACFCGNLEAVSILLENGADVDVTTEFNPIASTERVAMNPEERSVPFERGRFKLELWKLTAETVLMKLLNRCEPGHGRTLLHIAASICNYDRVVELVEQGFQPWVGDSKKVTPLGLLPNEVLEYSDQQTDGPPKDFIEQGLRIKVYLERQMILQARKFKSFDLINDPPPPPPPEIDSPFQLETQHKETVQKALAELNEAPIVTLVAMFNLSETYMMQERWTEAEELQRQILHGSQSAAECEDSFLVKVRSSLVHTLITVNKLDEAEILANAALIKITNKLLEANDSLKTLVLDTGSNLDILSQESTSRDIQELGSSLFDQVVAINAKAIDGIHESDSKTRYTAIAKALFDVSLIIQAHGENIKALRLKEKVIAAVRENSWCDEPHYHRMIGYLICNYCILEHWEDADRELKVYLGLLEFVAAEHFPLVNSNLLHVANTFRMYSKLEQVEMIYQLIHQYATRLRGPESYYASNALRLHVDLFEIQGRYKEAGEIQSQLLSIYKSAHGSQSAETQWQKVKLADIYEKEERLIECIILQRHALAVFNSFGHKERESVIAVKRLLSKALLKQQSYDEAEHLARENLAECRALGDEHADLVVNTISDLALVLNQQDRCEESQELYEEVLEKQEKVHGRIHGWTRNAMIDLLGVLIRANKIEQAETLGKDVIDVCEKMYGPESVHTAKAIFYLSTVYEKAGQNEKSRDIKRQVLDLERKICSVVDKDMIYTMTSLAQSHYILREIDQAVALQLEALNLYQQSEGDHAIRIMDTIFELACSYHEDGKLQDARQRYEEAIDMSRSLLGDQDERTMEMLAPLMALYTELDEYELAQDPAYEVLWFMEKAHGDDHPSTQEARNNVVIIVTSLEKWRDGERQTKKLVASLEKTHGESHPDTITAMNRLAECLTEQSKDEEAEALYERVLSLEHKSVH